MNKFFLIFLFFVGSASTPDRIHAASVSVQRYQCVMHPQIIRDKPGQCPICGMELVPIVEAASSAGDATGRAAFELSPERQQLIGLRVVKARIQSLSKNLRLAGRVSGGEVLAQLLEMDAGLLKAGMKATLVGPGGMESRAELSSVGGALDSVTRSFAVLISPSEKRTWMKSGVYCEARVEIPLGKGLAVPEEALVDTGERQLVFVRKGSRIEPREVVLGPRGSGMLRVLSGLSEGEECVVSANFLVDSEARFKAAAGAKP